MIATKQMDVRANIKKYFDMAFNGEPLKYGKSGSFSRRIDEANRLVCEVSDNQIVVKSCKGHYDN